MRFWLPRLHGAARCMAGGLLSNRMASVGRGMHRYRSGLRSAHGAAMLVPQEQLPPLEPAELEPQPGLVDPAPALPDGGAETQVPGSAAHDPFEGPSLPDLDGDPFEQDDYSNTGNQDETAATAPTVCPPRGGGPLLTSRVCAPRTAPFA